MPLAAILALAPQFISAGQSLLEFIQHVRASAQQTGEWDDAHETAFDEILRAAASRPEWKPRAEDAALRP